MSILSALSELVFGVATDVAADEVAHMAKDGSDDPVYKAKLQELIERNKAFETERTTAETDTRSQ